MALTTKQQEELNKALMSYMESSGFENAFNNFARETGYSSDESHKDMLEKKWATLLRLQSKLASLEAENRQMTDELSTSIRPEKMDMSVSMPREPAKFVCSGHKDVVRCLAFHPTSSILASAADDASIKVWDVETGKLLRSMAGHTEAVLDICFNPSGALLASASTDVTVKVWDFDKFICIKTLQGHEHSVSGVKFTPSGEFLLSCSRDKSIKVWNPQTGACVRTLSGHQDWVRRVDISADGAMVASASMDQDVCLWDFNSGQLLHTLKGHEHVVESVIFSNAASDKFIRDGIKASALKKIDAEKEAASAANSSRADGASAAEAASPSASAGAVAEAAAAVGGGGGAFVISTSRDKSIRIWNVKTGALVKTLLGHESWVKHAVVHPSGKFILTCSDDKSIMVWDLATWKIFKKMEGTNFIGFIDWSKSLPFFAAGGADKNVTIFECT